MLDPPTWVDPKCDEKKLLWPARNQIVRRNKNVSDARVQRLCFLSQGPASYDGREDQTFSVLSFYFLCGELFPHSGRVQIGARAKTIDRRYLGFALSPIFVQQDFALFSLYPAYSLFFGHTPPQSPPRYNVILPTAGDHFSCLQWRHEFFFISLFWDPNQLVVILCCR